MGIQFVQGEWVATCSNAAMIVESSSRRIFSMGLDETCIKEGSSVSAGFAYLVGLWVRCGAQQTINVGV